MDTFQGPGFSVQESVYESFWKTALLFWDIPGSLAVLDVDDSIEMGNDRS